MASARSGARGVRPLRRIPGRGSSILAVAGAAAVAPEVGRVFAEICGVRSLRSEIDHVADFWIAGDRVAASAGAGLRGITHIPRLAQRQP